MAEFVVGDKIKLDLDKPINKPYGSDFNASAQSLLAYLKINPNRFTVTKFETTSSGHELIRLKELSGSFYVERFTVIETSNFSATEQDLEQLLSDGNSA